MFKSLVSSFYKTVINIKSIYCIFDNIRRDFRSCELSVFRDTNKYVTPEPLSVTSQCVKWICFLVLTSKSSIFVSFAPVKSMCRLHALVHTVREKTWEWENDIPLKNLKESEFVHTQETVRSVSYTHLDVYKRQPVYSAM